MANILVEQLRHPRRVIFSAQQKIDRVQLIKDAVVAFEKRNPNDVEVKKIISSGNRPMNLVSEDVIELENSMSKDRAEAIKDAKFIFNQENPVLMKVSSRVRDITGKKTIGAFFERLKKRLNKI